MAAPRKYPDKLRERATRMAVELRADPATKNGAIQRGAEQLGMHPEMAAELGPPSRDRRRRAGGDHNQRWAAVGRARAGEPRAAAGQPHPEDGLGFLRGGARPPHQQVVAYLDAHRHDVVYGREVGVDPICAVLRDADVQIAPSGYYAAKTRPPSARAVRDIELVDNIQVAHTANLGVHGARKIHAELTREGVKVARCTVERLMKAEGLRGIVRDKTRKTTIGDGAQTKRPEDLVRREFVATGPNQLWVADLTHVRMHAGWTYVAFVLDVFSRIIVSWQVSTSLRTDLALDALDMGLWNRKRTGHDVTGLIHHSDRGVQYRAIRYTERLAEAEALA